MTKGTIKVWMGIILFAVIVFVMVGVLMKDKEERVEAVVATSQENKNETTNVTEIEEPMTVDANIHSKNSYYKEAQAIQRIRHRDEWSRYVTDLVKNTQRAIKKHTKISKLRFLLYPKNLRPSDLAEIIKDDDGIVWL